MNPNPAIHSTLRPLLVPFSGIYEAVIRLRNLRYDRNARASHAVQLPVISIGNITVGGTGKTPVVVETVRRLRKLGRRPAILTRGYGAARTEASDEVLEFAQALPEVPVVVNADRVAGAETARAEFGADSLVLDDGFQHRRLRRDLDVVLIDALDPWGGDWLLPAGRLREPLAGLQRADLFLISRANQVEHAEIERIEHVLDEHAPDSVALLATLEPSALVLLDQRVKKPADLGYHNVLPVCGIGNPATFLICVAQLAGRVCGRLLFRDHQRYTARHVRKIVEVARRGGADLVVTTRKDWVKLAPLWSRFAANDAPELARLDVRLVVQDPDGVFDDRLRRVLEKGV
jgi:tetraacyldisaccharide 4'-kinase